MIHLVLASVVSQSVQTAMQAHRTPAVQVGVVQNDKLVIDDAFGMANLKQRTPATPLTQFEIGSVTKQFTAAAILQLKEQGKLKLSDPLAKYVPNYPQGKAVTIEQLLWQVSGIPNYTEANHFVHIAGTTPGGVDAALRLIAKKPLDFKPGTRFDYSNTNYLLLGAVVARASHMPWEQYIRANIFTRAGMTHSAFIQDEPRLPNIATGYQRKKDGTFAAAPPLHGPWAGAAGGIVSTAEDMAKWDEAFFGGKIVSPQDVALATTAHRLPDGKSTGYGFGWFLDTHEGQPRIEHGGGTFGFTSENDYYPKLHEFVIVLANDVGPDTQFIASQAFDALHPDIAKADSQAAPGEDPAVSALAREWLHRAQTGTIDKSQLTDKFAKSLTPQAIAAAQRGLGALGEPTSFIFRGKTTNGNVTSYEYRVGFKTATLRLVISIGSSGKIADLDFTAD